MTLEYSDFFFFQDNCIMTPHSNNTWIIFIYSLLDFFQSSIDSFYTLLSWKQQENWTYSSLRKILNDGPKDFQNNPTGIWAGRSFFTLILSFFHYAPPSKK